MGLDLQDGIIQNLMLSVAMSLGSLIIPAVSDTYCRHHRLLAVLVCSVMGGLSIIGFMVSETVTGLSIFLCIGGFFLYAINGLVWPFAMDCGGRELSGTAGAIFGSIVFRQFCSFAAKSKNHPLCGCEKRTLYKKSPQKRI
jgi:sugar phosphate permease